MSWPKPVLLEGAPGKVTGPKDPYSAASVCPSDQGVISCRRQRCTWVRKRTDEFRSQRYALKKSLAYHKIQGRLIMLFTIAVVLAVLWVLGFVSGTTMGGLIHLLIVLAVIMVLFQLISGRRVG